MRCNLLDRQYLRLLPLLLALLLCGNPAQGQTKKQLERDKVKIEKEIARLNDELSKARKNSKNSTKQITLIKGRIQERTRLIDNINSQMALLDRQIGRTEDSLRMVRNQIDNMKAEYAQVVRTLYGLRQNISSTGLLFDNEQYNYSYLKMKYFAEYSRYRKHQETTIRRREQLFNDMSLDLQRQRKEKTSLLAQERKQRDALSREQQQQKKLNKSQQDEKSLQQQISKKEKQRRELQRQIQQLINAEVAKNSGGGASSSSGSSGTKNSSSTSGGNKTYNDAASSDFAQNRGRLPWPVYYKSVAREYGIYTHPSGGKNKNNGIDLNCAPGATVSAVFGGTVVKVDSFQGTKVVIVRHGAYMTVYAGLGTVSVSQGSKVATKQTLGTVYKGDEATSEFSFQVWCGGDALNPRHWLR